VCRNLFADFALERYSLDRGEASAALVLRSHLKSFLPAHVKPMGALFSKKKKYWVPEHRKLDDLLEDPQRSL
jgi:hypothetical protein